MDISEITGEAIERAQFKDKDFEQLVRALLRAERELRHRPDADIKGPVAEYRSDDKRDLVFIAHARPAQAREQFTAALTWDDQEPTWYSCKGGSNWRAAILTELGQRAYNEYQKYEKAPTARVKLRPPQKLLEHLAAGRRYVFVVASSEIEDNGLLDAAARQLEFWLGQSALDAPPALRQQLFFIDANKLAEFIAEYRPTTLNEGFRARLGIDEPEGLKSWTQWTAELAQQRDLPAFENDGQREAVLAAIADESTRVIRLFGPPGVGKTRAVHEAVRRLGPETQARIRYCGDPELNRRVVESRWLRDNGAVWLVLDELRSVDVDQIIPLFYANANSKPGARLILVGTSDERTRPVAGKEFAIAELEERSIRNLIRNESVGISDQQIEAISFLSEGYPWYAVLLTRAVSEDEEALVHGDDDATRWNYGTRRVLAGNPAEYGNQHAWNREAELRGKALLVAMLTRDLELEWEHLWDRHGEGLRLAIDEPSEWHEVKTRERVCRQRQLLRHSGVIATRRYVSPNNLARLILHHFLTDPDLGPKIRRHTPDLRGSLLTLAKSVMVNPAILERLSRGEWEELERRVYEEGIEAADAYLRVPEPSLLVAHEQPEAAAHALSRIVTSLRAEQLEAAGNLRGVAKFVFQHVIHRKISSRTFLAVESALIALIRFDRTLDLNNARGIWMSLFLPGFHLTHQPWPLRRDRLDERLVAADVFVRDLAVTALVAAVEPWEMTTLGYTEVDRRDGDWPAISEEEFKQQKAELWQRLIRASDDREHDISQYARSGIAQRLRSGLGRGLFADHLEQLTRVVPSWSPAQRREMVESITNIRRYDAEEYHDAPELLEALTPLEQAAAPTNLLERVRAQFGSWHPGAWRIDDPRRRELEAAVDTELARSLLTNPDALAFAFEWASGPEVRRASALWSALGRVDREASLAERLTRQVGEGLPARALADYALGRAEVCDVEAVEGWLFEQDVANEAALGEAALLFLVRQEPSRARLNRIQSLVASGVVIPGALVRLGHYNWVESIDAGTMIEFLLVVSKQDDLVEATLLLSLRLLERKLDERQRCTVLDVLTQSLRNCLKRRVVIGLQSDYMHAVLALAEAGEFEVVSELVIEALETNEGANLGLGDMLLNALFGRGHGERLWSHFAAELAKLEFSPITWVLANSGLLGQVPPEMVLEWVGDDSRRARVVADLTNPHAAVLDPVARALLLRFGDRGGVGAKLRSRALSTPGVVRGEMSFERRQRDHARAWQRDESPVVQAWAQDIEQFFTRRIDEYEARREFRAKYG